MDAAVVLVRLELRCPNVTRYTYSPLTSLWTAAAVAFIVLAAMATQVHTPLAVVIIVTILVQAFPEQQATKLQPLLSLSRTFLILVCKVQFCA